MSKHTPGPWIQTEYKSDQYPLEVGLVIQASGLTLANVYALKLFENVDEARANARLIAKAPEMLEELEAAHKIIQNALNIMTVEQKRQWNEINDRAGILVDIGATRANKRESVINKARGKP